MAQEIDLFDTGKSASFLRIGDKVRGTVVGKPKTMQQREFNPDGPGKLKFWDDGEPMLQLVFRLSDTGQRDSADPFDDGTRFVYAKKGKNLYNAIVAAVKSGGARSMSDLDGGTLEIEYTEDIKGKGAQPAKGYRASFIKGAPTQNPSELFD